VTVAELRVQRYGPSPGAANAFKNAAEALATTALDTARAEALLQRGMIYHDLAGDRRGPLQEAVRCYQEALTIFTRAAHPEAFALAQNNLGLAYLAMPFATADDQLRIAVAIQALREARAVYDPETHPDAWASTTVNLANALQRAPSAQTEEHLWQAVQLYDDVLEVRTREANPPAYARTLANQGTALAHLGAFAKAVPRLQDAQAIFREHGLDDAADALQGTLDEIDAFSATPTPKHGASRETTV
jgi:tetratricopeptide (TPR) repeat protein